jgi:hypothetical protein
VAVLGEARMLAVEAIPSAPETVAAARPVHDATGAHPRDVGETVAVHVGELRVGVGEAHRIAAPRQAVHDGIVGQLGALRPGGEAGAELTDAAG